jgi:outer membrane protein assembly factor BamB
MKHRKRIPILLSGVLFLSFITSVPAQDQPHWPAFHGPDRSNKSTETGLLAEWPEEGLELFWTVSGLGKGYSTVSLADGFIFTSGTGDLQTLVFAYDLEGKLLWKKPNGGSWETEMSHARTYNGARSTPTYSDGVVYHLGDLGRLAAFDAKSGNELWSMELREEYEAEIPEYGYAESVYVEGDRLYCCPAGKKAYMVCLNKHDGKVIWENNQIGGTVGFSSLIRFDHGGFRQIAGLSSDRIFAVDSETGKLLWQVEYENSRSNNVPDLIFHDGFVFASSGYGKGSILLDVVAYGGAITPETVWQTELMDNHHGGVILHEGYLYGAGHNSRGWFCLDFRTGEEMWKAPGKGSITYAEQRLYCLDERGTMRLVRADPEQYEELGSFTVPEGGNSMHWAHPVVCGGRLYIRHEDKLFAYDISGR